MKERPILFNGPMVRALLDGSKTQTRRAVKFPHNSPLGEWEPTTIGGPDGGMTRDGGTIPTQGAIWHTRTGDLLACPYGQPGDQIWVREAWSQPTTLDPGPTLYRADYPACVPYRTENIPPADEIKWKPSIHMPRRVCRIMLEVTGVRVERLHDITDNDCIAEGCAGGHRSIPEYQYNATPSEHYRHIWKSTGGDWEANPWVWVIEFRRIEL